MKRFRTAAALAALLCLRGAVALPAADDLPAPSAPPGRPTREELRERIKNLTPEERQARLRDFRESQAQAPGGPGRETFEKRRQERAQLLNEIKDLAPAQREAKLKDFRERGGLNRPGFSTLNPEERDAKRREFQQRVASEIATLQAQKSRGRWDDDSERSLQRMEMIAQRLAQVSQPLTGAPSPPVEKPVKRPGNP